MMSRSGLKWGVLSITGNFRENNEDNCIADEQGRFFLVADGMGGQSAGEKASELAIELISKKLNQLIDWQGGDSDQEVVRKIDSAVENANSEIIALGEIEPSFKNMGTTITFVVALGQHLYVGGVGDSRTYRLSDGILEQLTEDHSLTQALVKAGTISPEDAQNHRYKNVLYRYLGAKDGGSGTEAKRIEIKSGDRYLLCTDGISDGASDEVIHRVLQDNDDPSVAAETMVQCALDGGSKDNITCIVLHVD